MAARRSRGCHFGDSGRRASFPGETMRAAPGRAAD
jgi:hypothetical protein